MRPTSINPRENPNVLNTQKFEKRKGYFILNFDMIITENYIVNVEQQYQLIAFKAHGEIELRNVSFWHAAIKNNYLKIIVYDLNNKVVLQRQHDLNKPRYNNDWFIIDPEVFEDDLLEFE